MLCTILIASSMQNRVINVCPKNSVWGLAALLKDMQREAHQQPWLDVRHGPAKEPFPVAHVRQQIGTPSLEICTLNLSTLRHFNLHGATSNDHRKDLPVFAAGMR